MPERVASVRQNVWHAQPRTMHHPGHKSELLRAQSANLRSERDCLPIRAVAHRSTATSHAKNARAGRKRETKRMARTTTDHAPSPAQVRTIACSIRKTTQRIRFLPIKLSLIVVPRRAMQKMPERVASVRQNVWHAQPRTTHQHRHKSELLRAQSANQRTESDSRSSLQMKHASLCPGSHKHDIMHAQPPAAHQHQHRPRSDLLPACPERRAWQHKTSCVNLRKNHLGSLHPLKKGCPGEVQDAEVLSLRPGGRSFFQHLHGFAPVPQLSESWDVVGSAYTEPGFEVRCDALPTEFSEYNWAHCTTQGGPAGDGILGACRTTSTKSCSLPSQCYLYALAFAPQRDTSASPLSAPLHTPGGDLRSLAHLESEHRKKGQLFSQNTQSTASSSAWNAPDSVS